VRVSLVVKKETKMLDAKLATLSKIQEEYPECVIPESYEGYKLVTHVWHQPSLLWLMTYEQLLNRLIEIYETKPKAERSERYSLIKVVEHEFDSPTYHVLLEARRRWDEGDCEWDEADRKRDGAVREWNGGDCEWDGAECEWDEEDCERDEAECEWIEARCEWEAAEYEWIKQVHDDLCPNCKWDGNGLPQFYI